jgi:hypothetical protein
MRADLVAGPKVVDSSPLDPAPLIDTVNPCEFRNICSCLTSSPLIPSDRLRLNGYGEVFVVVVVVYVNGYVSCIVFVVVVGVRDIDEPPPPPPLLLDGVDVTAVGIVVNVATTTLSDVEFTVQLPVPEHTPPVQPENVDPESGVAVRISVVESFTTSEQSLPQDIPVPDTVPVPEPSLVTDTVYVTGGVVVSIIEYVEKLGTVNTRVPFMYEMIVHVVHSTPSLITFGVFAVRLYSVTVAVLFSSGIRVESRDSVPLDIDIFASRSRGSPVLFTRVSGVEYEILPRLFCISNEDILFRSALARLTDVVNFVVRGRAQP